MEGNPFPFNSMNESQDSLNQVYCHFRVGSRGGGGGRREGGGGGFAHIYKYIYIHMYISWFSLALNA